MGNLDFGEAQEACRQRGLHVCRRGEWELACAGPQQRRWPYGNTYEPDRCFDESQASQSHSGEAAPSGMAERCHTPEGVYDMSGNLWEWVAQDNGGVLRGGGWNISAGLGQCRARAAARQDYAVAETGTRCCATAEEALRLGAAP